MAKLGIHTGADLAAKDIDFLRQHFGSFAGYLYRAARGIDLRRVSAHRERKSVSGERTFNDDISSGPRLREVLDDIVEIVWERIERSKSRGRTVTLKMRYSDFRIITRSRSAGHYIEDKGEFAQFAAELLDQTLPLPLPIRLMGLGLSNMEGESSNEKAEGEDPQLSLL